jgi:nitrate reductase alpha subunit
MAVYKRTTEWGLSIWHLRLSFGGGAFHLSQAMVHAPHAWQRLLLRLRGYRPHRQSNGYWYSKSGRAKWRTLELMRIHDVHYLNPPKSARAFLKARQ